MEDSHKVFGRAIQISSGSIGENWLNCGKARRKTPQDDLLSERGETSQSIRLAIFEEALEYINVQSGRHQDDLERSSQSADNIRELLEEQLHLQVTKVRIIEDKSRGAIQGMLEVPRCGLGLDHPRSHIDHDRLA